MTVGGRRDDRAGRDRRTPVLEVTGLAKRYGDWQAVHDVSFEVAEGEIFGLLGPNGAGKTTTVECVQGLRDARRGHGPGAGPGPARPTRQRCGR